MRRPAQPKRMLEHSETASQERRKSVRLADQDAINTAKEVSLAEMMMIEKEATGNEKRGGRPNKDESLNELVERVRDSHK